jgi:hypothetical protein
VAFADFAPQVPADEAADECTNRHVGQQHDNEVDGSGHYSDFVRSKLKLFE